jgi:glucokinase
LKTIDSTADSAIGIDIGGTRIKACLLNSRGEILLSELHDTDTKCQGPELLELVAGIYIRFSARQPVCGIGLGLPAAVEGTSGRVLPGTSNIQCLLEYPIYDELRRRLGVVCRVDNDANQALRAEAHFGVARSSKNVLGLTLGTAVGGGLILGGRLWRGTRGVAGEIGMTYVPTPPMGAASGCLSPQSMESVASAGAIEQRMQKPCSEVFQNAAGGEPEASRALQDAIQALALAVTNAHLLLDLELVVLGGGMAQGGVDFRDRVAVAFQRFCPREYGSTLRFELSSLGSFAGAMGSAASVLEEASQLRSLAR